MTSNSRLDAVKNLLGDKVNRLEKSHWQAILFDESLVPPLGDVGFEKSVYSLLISEMEEGYRRKDKLIREKPQEAGRLGKYLPSQMHISPDIGRYIFAYFEWHGINSGKAELEIEQNELEDLALAFKFKMDVSENTLQFLTKEERSTALDKSENEDYNQRVYWLVFGGLAISVIAVMNFINRHAGH